MPHLDIVALDASPQPVACARANAERLGFAARVRVEQAFFPDACPQDAGCYDLIVSNPPYIPSGDIELLSPDIREYEPRLALDGGSDGLEVYRQWISHCVQLLAIGGALMLEIGHDQGPGVTELLFAAGNVTSIEVVRDYAHLDRVVICRKA
jgi:release factor glutamine methyltransferase